MKLRSQGTQTPADGVQGLERGAWFSRPPRGSAAPSLPLPPAASAATPPAHCASASSLLSRALLQSLTSCFLFRRFRDAHPAPFMR